MKPDVCESKLDRAQQPMTVRLAVLSDTHLATPGTPDDVWNNVIRRSVALPLLRAAVNDVVERRHTTVLVLGDISDDGSPELISNALSVIADAGLAAWVLPGNHDAAVRPDAVEAAVRSVAACTVLYRSAQRPVPCIAVTGVGLESGDSGQTCTAVDLPDVTGTAQELLLWIGHYPLLSQAGRLRAAGLRYPGDLLNLAQVREAALRFPGPILVLHGHLHTTVTRRSKRVLQLGCPAIVEWPHAWTDLTVRVDSGRVRLQATTRAVPGEWSHRQRNTQLVDPHQSWRFDSGHWRRTGDTVSTPSDTRPDGASSTPATHNRRTADDGTHD